MITRFAPSPTGPLHLGHAYSALLASDTADAAGGTFVLRIEDIDRTRSRDTWEAQIYEDLRWLGLHWPEPALRQSDRLARYAADLDTLWRMGLLYPCTCSRRDIAEAASAPQEGAPMHGPDGLVYPGTCRPKPKLAHSTGPRPESTALRLNMARAMALLGDRATLAFEEKIGDAEDAAGWVTRSNAHMIDHVGDIVLSRKDFLGSYHLSVVRDDADQGITDVVRGADLFDATPIHVLLQRLLGLSTPRYHHHRLIRDTQGKRLAKRDDARAISVYRAEGKSPRDIRDLLGF